MVNNNQHGFRMGHSCLTQLLAHYEKVLTSLENNKDVDVVYVDSAKAFDKVDHFAKLVFLVNWGGGCTAF